MTSLSMQLNKVDQRLGFLASKHTQLEEESKNVSEVIFESTENVKKLVKRVNKLEEQDENLVAETKKIIDRVSKIEAQCSDNTRCNDTANKIGGMALGTMVTIVVIGSTPPVVAVPLTSALVVTAIGSVGYFGYKGVKAAKDRCSIM